MSSPIITLSAFCLNHCASIVEETKSEHYSPRTYEVSRFEWEMALRELQIWMIETSAIRDDHDPASLTFKLQDREHIADALISLLVYLKETLTAAEISVKKEQDQDEIEKVRERAARRSRRIYMEGYDERTELQCLCATVKAIISCLDAMAVLAMPRERLVDKFL